MSLTCDRGVDSLGVDFEVLLALALLRRGGRPRSFRIAAEAPRSDAAAQAPGRGRHQRVVRNAAKPRKTLPREGFNSDTPLGTKKEALKYCRGIPPLVQTDNFAWPRGVCRI